MHTHTHTHAHTHLSLWHRLRQRREGRLWHKALVQRHCHDRRSGRRDPASCRRFCGIACSAIVTRDSGGLIARLEAAAAVIICERLTIA